ncbi:MAG: ATPase [Peptostreptococcaceae bacterium]
MYVYASQFLNKYVEVYTYLSQQKLYGTVIKVTPVEIILNREHIEKASNKNYDLYLPLSSIIYIREL